MCAPISSAAAPVNFERPWRDFVNRITKVGVVLAGYVAAIVAAGAAGWLYDWRLRGAPDTSGGMYAFGQLLGVLAVFFAVSLVPTALALWWLRRNEKFWGAVAVTSLALASIGLLAVLSPLVLGTGDDRGWRMLLELVRLSQLLGVPLWTAALVLFAVLAPFQGARHKLIAAVAIELVIGVVACVHWFVPRPPL
jgi:hypothetical protein